MTNFKKWDSKILRAQRTMTKIDWLHITEYYFKAEKLSYHVIKKLKNRISCVNQRIKKLKLIMYILYSDIFVWCIAVIAILHTIINI